MKLISTSGNKTFYVIPRKYNTGNLTVKLRNETTNISIEVTSTPIIEGNYLKFDAVFGSLIENNFYNLELIASNGGDIVYKDKIFCTNQTINQSNNDYYDINKDQYITEDSYNNDYVII
tara:strand:- start:1288 stop:1644 length:357 start_codon:yes stop_codon:yes gene_type:complete